MNSLKNLVISVIMLFVIVFLFTIGYMLIGEEWTALDAFYMTIITLTTVGYGEIHPLGEIGRTYTIFLIIFGAGYWVYVIASVVQFIVEGRIQRMFGRRRLDHKINRLNKHCIICGYGRIGQVLCEKLLEKPMDIVVIEKDEALIDGLEEDKYLFIAGDASDESMLQKAGIERAEILVAALGTDTANVFLVLTARQLNPRLQIIARAGHLESRRKLYAAGANRVESPYDIGAASMAQRILRPTVTNFLDLAVGSSRKDIQMEEIPVSFKSSLVNVMLKDSGIRQNFNLILIAIKKAEGGMVFNPSFETKILGGDTVIAVGESNNLRKLEKILNP